MAASFLASIIGGPFSTPVGQLIEKATDVAQVSENWSLYMEICDLVNSSDDGPRDAIKAIKKQLSNNIGKNNVVILYTLTVVETCVKNCGKRFHILVAQKDFLQELIRVISPKGNPPQVVVDKVLGILQTWADAFQGIEELKEVERVCKELKDKGMEFPMTDLDRVAPIHTPARSTPLPPPAEPVPHSPTRIQPEPIEVAPGILPEMDPGLVASDPERIAKIRSQLDIVQQNCKVMGEMLTEMTPGQEALPDDWQLLVELNATCRQMQKRIVELIECMPSEEITCELLRINDDVNNVLLRYERYERLRAGQTNQAGSTPSAPSANTLQHPKSESSDNKAGGSVVAATGNLLGLDDDDDELLQTDLSRPPVDADDAMSRTATLDIRGSAGAASNNAATAASVDDANKYEEFDMFAQSRQSYEASCQALKSGDTYERHKDDQLLSGLGAAITLKSTADPYMDDGKADEMEQWMKDATQSHATSSEFDEFLATRATESDKLLDQDAAAASSQGQRSASTSNRGARTLKNEGDDENALFSL